MAARPLKLRAQDPIAVVIATVVGVAAEAGFFEWLGLGATAIAEIMAGLLALAAIVRHVMERKRDADVVRLIETAKALEPAGRAIHKAIKREGAAGEGGELEIGETPVEGIPAPKSDPDRVNRRGFVRVDVLGLLVAGVLAVLLLGGCAGLGSYTAPGVGDLIGRVDVGKVIQCARQPTPKDKARCLGLEVLTQGVDLALTEAGKLAESAIEAANPHAGAELSARDERALARDLDRALNRLGHEIALAE